MCSTRKTKKCRFVFIIYYIILFISPYSHSHADSEPYLVASHGPVYSSEHVDSHIADVRHDEHFMDRHGSHDDRHLHFLAEASNPPSRHSAVEKAAPLKDIPIPETVITKSSKYSVVTMIQDHARSYYDGDR